MQPTVSVLSHLRLNISIIQVQAFVMHSGVGVELRSYTRTLSDSHFPEAERPPEKAQKHMPQAVEIGVETEAEADVCMKDNICFREKLRTLAN